MKWFDRGLLLVLTLGVWVLVLQPTQLTAHDSDDHDCSFSWSGGYGENDGSEVYVYSGEGSVDCSHY